MVFIYVHRKITFFSLTGNTYSTILFPVNYIFQAVHSSRRLINFNIFNLSKHFQDMKYRP